MLDLSRYDILAPSEEGRWWHPVHPANGRKLTDAAGNAFGILLVGRHSAVAKDAIRRTADQRAIMQEQGQRETEADSERMNAEFLARCTKAWTEFVLDGVVMTFTYENAVKLWSDRRFSWMHPSARAFILDDGGFLPA